jgi:hypothetical protein
MLFLRKAVLHSLYVRVDRYTTVRLKQKNAGSAARVFQCITISSTEDQLTEASFCQVSITVSGFKEIEAMPCFISHSAKSGWSDGP